jgi:hypothetical protein
MGGLIEHGGADGDSHSGLMAGIQPLFGLVPVGMTIYPKARCTSNVPPLRIRK